MNARLSLIAVAAALLAGCGSATDAVTFQAPPSYHSKASLGPFMQIWQGDRKNDIIILMALPVQTDLNKAMDQANLKDAKVQKSKRVKICGGTQDAIYAQVEGTTVEGDQKSEPSEIEFVATNVKGKTYMAMYARPLRAAADPSASAAVRNICPK